MIIAIHFDPAEARDSFYHYWHSELTKRKINVRVLNFRTNDIIEKVKGCAGVMWHWAHNPDDKQSAPKILNAIEFGLKIPVFPSFATRNHYDEKISQYYLLKSVNAPVIKTWIFWNRKEANKFVRKTEYPIVFKLSVGASSSNVLKIDNQEEAQRLVDLMFQEGMKPYTFNEFEDSEKLRFVNRVKRAVKHIQGKSNLDRHWYYLLQKNYIYFQEFLPDNDYDIRVTVIGNRAFAILRYNRDNDFRASGSGMKNYDPAKVPMGSIRIAHEISKKCGFQSMAYDLLHDKDGKLRIAEISYGYVAGEHGPYKCRGYWDRDLKWHKGHILPETAQVEDFLYYIKNGKLI